MLRFMRKNSFKLTAIAALTVLPLMNSAAFSKDVKLKVQSAWPLTLPASGRDAQYFADQVNRFPQSGVKIKLYSAGKLVPSLEIFDAVRNGRLDAGYTSPLYVAGKLPAVQLFGGVPFGPNQLEYVSWLYNGGGLDIWRETYAKQGVVPVPCGLMDSESGGWYKEPINNIEDFKGKKLRFAGLAGEILKKAGASIVLLPGGEIYSSLEKNVIDGTEFSMPAIDAAMGFERVAKNYYLPGWHQPAAFNELIVNKKKWDAMTDEQRAVIETSCRQTMQWGTTSTFEENALAIEKFKDAGVEIRTFSPEILEKLSAAMDEVIAEQTAKSDDFKKTWESLTNYRQKVRSWGQYK
ncbi:MAG: TRAP transporter substrate-binding protein [Methylocystaceae bacterium]|nr:TRAP transporter substrate-binding protein [Methylocystaceae bacterium]